MIVGDRQQLGLSFGEPLPRRRALAFGAVAVAAGVVGDLDMAAVVAARDMTAERCGAAGRYRRHDLELAEAEMSCVGARIGGAVNAQDIRDLQGRPRHGVAVRRAALALSGLRTDAPAGW